jgi:DNA-binding CsgD family transcriptional regulator/tetratricopeptide (TPR) repeat protein/nucleoside-triphosphatase THEP1
MRPYGPLRGRDELLVAALRVVRRTHDHRASGVVLVSGDPGIGKTALLSEIARQAVHLHMRVARSKCDEIGEAHLGAPILGLLRAGRDPLIAAADFEALTELTGNPLVLVDRVAGHLRTVAATHRVLIVVDDVQWADPVSRYALRSLIPRLAGWPVVWVLASRSRAGGISISAADMVEVEHICLGPLPRDAITGIARDRLGRGLGDDEQEVLDAAGGNPFLATQIVEGLARRAESGRDGVPAEFPAAMRYRLAGLSSTSRDLIDALAVAGRAVGVAELFRVCDIAAGPDYDEAIDAAVASGLVASTGTELAFIHNLVRQCLYESIASDVRRRLHTRFAQHFLAAADPALAAAHAKVAVTVGDASNARVMLAAAEALATTSAADAADLALSAFEVLRPGQPWWVELGERAVAVLSTAQRANDTIAVADRLLATVDDVDTVSRIQTHAVKALWHNGRFAEIMERAGRTLERTGERPDLVARFGAAQALACTRIVGADAAAERADTALAHARTAGDRDALAFGLQAAGEAAHAQRRHQLALKHFRELRSVTGISYLAEEIMQLQLLDRYDDAQMLLDAALEDSHASAEALAPSVLFAQAKQHYNLGDLRDADQVAASVVELGQLIGTKEQVVEATLIRVFIALLRGEPALATRRLRWVSGVLGEDDATRHPGVVYCQGWLSAARGDAEHGLATWSQLLVEPESYSYSAWWPCWMPVLFEAAKACRAVDLMKVVVAIAEEAAARNPEVATLNGVAANLRGLLNDDLAMVAESLEILQRSPRRGLRALGAESYGLMLLDAGQRQIGLDQLDQAWDDYDHMGALARRAAVQRVMRQAGARRAKWSTNNSGSVHRPLTDAERRVVYLIADGHTDKSAARALGISANTVGTHMRSAYAKLGVQSRVQLTNALRVRGELD